MMCNILVSHVSLQIITLFLVTAVSCLRYPVITKGNSNNNNEGRAQFKALSIQKCKRIYLRDACLTFNLFLLNPSQK